MGEDFQPMELSAAMADPTRPRSQTNPLPVPEGLVGGEEADKLSPLASSAVQGTGGNPKLFAQSSTSSSVDSGSGAPPVPLGETSDWGTVRLSQIQMDSGEFPTGKPSSPSSLGASAPPSVDLPNPLESSAAVVRQPSQKSPAHGAPSNPKTFDESKAGDDDKDPAQLSSTPAAPAGSERPPSLRSETSSKRKLAPLFMQTPSKMDGTAGPGESPTDGKEHDRKRGVSLPPALEGGGKELKHRLLGSIPSSPSRRIFLEQQSPAGSMTMRSPAGSITLRSPVRIPTMHNRVTSEPYQMPDFSLSKKADGDDAGSDVFSDSSEDLDEEDDLAFMDSFRNRKPINRSKADVSDTAAWLTQRLDDILGSDRMSDSGSDSEDEDEDGEITEIVKNKSATMGPTTLKGQDWVTQRMSILKNLEEDSDSPEPSPSAAMMQKAHDRSREFAKSKSVHKATRRLASIESDDSEEDEKEQAAEDVVEAGPESNAPKKDGDTRPLPGTRTGSAEQQENEVESESESGSATEEDEGEDEFTTDPPKTPERAQAEPPKASEGFLSSSPGTFAGFLSSISIRIMSATGSSEKLPQKEKESTQREGLLRGQTSPRVVDKSAEAARVARLEPNPIISLEAPPVVEESVGPEGTPWLEHPTGSTEEFFSILQALMNGQSTMEAKWKRYAPQAKEVFAEDVDLDLTKRRGGAYNGDMRQQNIHGEVATSLAELYEAAEHGRYVFRKLVRSVIDGPDSLSPRNKKGQRQSFRLHEKNILPLKHRGTAHEKAMEEYELREPGPPVSWLYDIQRAYVVCDSIAEMDATLSKISEGVRLLNGTVIRVKNRLFTPNPTGYRDILVNVQLPVPKPAEASGAMGADESYYIVAEIQIELQEFRAVSEARRMDLIYAYFRSFLEGRSNVRLLYSHLRVLEFLHHCKMEGKNLNETATELTQKGGPASYEELELLLSLLCQLKAYESALVVAVRLLSITVAEIRHSSEAKKSPAVALAVSRISDVLVEMGEVDAALEKKGEALDIMKNACDTGLHEDVLKILNGVGVCMALGRRHRQALGTFKREAEDRRNLLGPLDASVAAVLCQSAQMCLELRRYREALNDYHEALEIRRESLGTESLVTAETLNDMGLTLSLLGRFHEAFMRHEEAARIFDAEFGVRHASSICARTAMARALQNQGQVAEALRECEAVLELGKTTESTDPAELPELLAITKGHSAELLAMHEQQEQKELAKTRYEEAISELRSICASGKTEPPPSPGKSKDNAPDSLASGFGLRLYTTESRGILSTGLGLGYGVGSEAALMENLDGLASVYQYDLEMYEAAMALHQEVCDLRKRKFGAQHPDVAQTLTNMANLYQLMEQESDALPLYREALAIYEATLEPGDPLQGITSYNLAILLHDSLDQPEEGRQLAEKAYEIFLKAGGAEHPYSEMLRETLSAWEESA